MRSTLYDNFGGFKVWQRPLNKGRGHRYEVRDGNRVLARHTTLLAAMDDANARMEAFWREQARVLKEMRKEAQ